jgi:hypothetical protein
MGFSLNGYFSLPKSVYGCALLWMSGSVQVCFANPKGNLINQHASDEMND